MQHRDGDDEGEVEPVGHIDMRLLALEQRAQEDDQIGHPDDGQPQIDIPFRLGIFAALGNAQQIAGRRHDDEQLIAPEHEPGEIAAKQPRAGGALDHVERRRDQRVAAEGEDHRRGVQRTGPAEIQPGLDVEIRIGELEGDDDAHQKADNTPEGGGDDAVTDNLVEIAGFVVGRFARGG
jgi:hypothetical protein